MSYDAASIVPQSVRHAPVVVIGGGIRGLSIAYYLARAGVSVALVEQYSLLAGASGANNGWVNVSGKHPAFYTLLSLQSANLFHDLGAELDADIEYECLGGVYVADTEEALEARVQFATQQSRVPGVDVEVLAAVEARRLEPVLSRHIVGATYCALDGVVNPWKLGRAYAVAAKHHGCRFCLHTEVLGIRIEGGRVTAAITDGGTIETDVVVDAAGVQAGVIGQMVGVEIPVVALRGQVLVTEPLPRILGRPTSGLNQTRDGNFLIGTTHDLGLGTCDRHVEYETIGAIARRAIRILPRLKDVHIIRTFAGVRPWPIDGLPIMGTRPDWPKGFICAVGHSGITLAPITGKLISELVISGETSWPIEEYSPTRFDQVSMTFPSAMYRWLCRSERACAGHAFAEF
jgi:sarcosine oxidase subunit beta